MIIFGFRGVRMTRDTGLFDCPDCQRTTEYRLRGVRNFITLYFIPIVPLTWEGGDEEVRCSVCKSKYPAGVLDGSWPAEESLDDIDQIDWMIRQFAMIPMLVSKGIVQESDRQLMIQLFKKNFDVLPDPDQLNHEIEHVQTHGIEASMEALALVNTTLDDWQKRKMIKAAWQMGVADGPLDPSEWKVLASLGEALGMPAEQIDAAIVEAEQQLAEN